MPTRDLVVQLRSETADYVRNMKAAEQQTARFAAEQRRQEQATRRMGQTQIRAEREMAASRKEALDKQHAAMTKTGQALTAFGVASIAGLGLATKAAIDWESAWAGVTKTVNGSQKQMDALESGLRDLAKTLPASHREIAGVAEAAGQLGIQRGAILGFTKTMVDLGETTNLTAQEAATAMARMANIMQTPQDEIDRLGSALVALGNDGASTEKEIVEMALRIAGAGHTIGLTESDVLGFANALSSVGIEAEAGGSAISRVMIDIAQSVRQGGDKLRVFAQVAGMSAADFQKAFQADAAGAITSFVEGLGRIQASGGDTFGILDKLELSEIRVRDALLRASSAGDLLRDSLATGSQAWRDNTALVEEANKRYETAAARIQIARNKLHDAAIDIGATLAPAVASAAEAAGGLAEQFQALPVGAQKTVTMLGAVAGAASLAGGAALILIPKINDAATAMSDLGIGGDKAQKGMKGLAKGAAVAPLVLGLAIAVNELKDAVSGQPISQDLSGMARALEVFGKSGQATGELTKTFGKDFSGVTHRFRADGESLSQTIANVADDTAWQRFWDKSDVFHKNVRAIDDALAQLVSSGNPDAAEKAFGRLAEQARKAGVSQEQLVKMFPQYADALAQQKVLAEGAAGATDKHGKALDGTTVDLEEQKTAAEQLKDQIDALTGATRTAYGAETSFGEAVLGLTKSLKDNGRTFAANTEKGLQNRSAILRAAEAANDHAQAVADQTGSVAKGSRTLDGHREQLIRVLRQSGFTRAEAKRYVEQLLKVPKSVKTDVKADTRPARTAVSVLVRDYNRMLNRISDESVQIKMGISGAALSALRSASISLAREHLRRATGGPIPGHSPSPTADNIPVMATAGEHYWSVREVAGAGGHGNVKRLRDMARAGTLHLAAGGAVTIRTSGRADLANMRAAAAIASDTRKTIAANYRYQLQALVDAAAAFGLGGPTSPGLAGALAFARSQAGKPYIWGGVGPGGFDCSGFQSAITNVIRGRNPYSRLGSTGTFPWSGFVSGTGAYMIGSFRGSPGHMAGTLNGVNVESRGGEGVVIGSRARGARHSMFSTVRRLRGYARGGPVDGDPPFDIFDPRGMHANEFWDLMRERRRFDDGGVAYGRGPFWKGPGVERVLSPVQTAAFENLVRVLDRSGGGAVHNHYTINFPNYLGDKADLIRGLDSLSRQGKLDTIVRRSSR